MFLTEININETEFNGMNNYPHCPTQSAPAPLPDTQLTEEQIILMLKDGLTY